MGEQDLIREMLAALKLARGGTAMYVVRSRSFGIKAEGMRVLQRCDAAISRAEAALAV